jgi:Ricin-type beta-trefoil lectin domain-like
MLKIGNTYYIFCSHLSGWAANDNEYATATSISGPWSALQTFAPSGTNTYTSQTTWIEAVAGTGGTTYMYMGDRWNSSSLPTSLAHSTYIWLPLNISGNTVRMPWYDRWTLNVPAGTWAITGTSFVTGRPVNIVNSATGFCLDVTGASSNQGVQLDAWTCNAGSNQNWTMSVQGGGYSVTTQLDGQVMDASGQSTQSGSAVIQWPANGGTNQQWTFTSNGSGAYTIRNVGSSLCLQPASTANGALMEQVSCSSSTSQLWKIVD